MPQEQVPLMMQWLSVSGVFNGSTDVTLGPGGFARSNPDVMVFRNAQDSGNIGIIDPVKAINAALASNLPAGIDVADQGRLAVVGQLANAYLIKDLWIQAEGSTTTALVQHAFRTTGVDQAGVNFTMTMIAKAYNLVEQTAPDAFVLDECLLVYPWSRLYFTTNSALADQTISVSFVAYPIMEVGSITDLCCCPSGVSEVV